MAGLLKLKVLTGPEYHLVANLMESHEDCLAETRSRVRSLFYLAKHQATAPDQKKIALKLALHLGDPFIEERPTIDPLVARQTRLRVIPQVIRLAEKPDYGPVTTATVIPRHGLMTPDKLMTVNAADLKAALRSALNRAGAAQAKGWLLAGLHGSFDLVGKFYQLHWHLVAAGGMIDVVNVLRNQQQYRSNREPDSEVFQRVMIRREPINDLARALTYIMQTFWPCRWVGTTEDGALTRLSRRTRIPEPYHSRWLLWMHKQRLSDLLLPMKLTVRDGELKVQRR